MRSGANSTNAMALRVAQSEPQSNGAAVPLFDEADLAVIGGQTYG